MEAVEVLGDRYRLVERLGTGGMSVVWRAHDEVLGRPVAIKVLATKLAADRRSREMIRAEAQAAARLSHPHVTSVYDYGESITRDGETVPYVVMELISGRTLAERLSGGPMPWRAALRVGAEVAAALAAAHARGLVHRDVKPGNVMLTASGAKVVDFGIAAIAGEAGDSGPDGVVLGTPAYLAPERLAGGPVRPATDVYGLGLLLYRTLTGGLPWAAETTTQMINAHVYVEPDRLPSITGLPDGISELCLRCLAKNPEDRPTSREVAQELAAAAGIRVPLPAGRDEPDDLALDPVPLTQGPRTGRSPGRLRLAAAALFGPGIDAGAETSILPGSVIDSAAIRNARRLRHRRAVQVAGVTAGVATAGLLAAAYVDLPGRQATPLAIAGQTAATRAPCAVRYVTRSDNASQFDVELTITNTSARPLDRWTLQFTFTGDQTLGQGSDGEWVQSPARVVTVRGTVGDPSLAPGGAKTLHFSAGYHTANPLPTEFTLNGASCAYVLVGASGETRTGGPGQGSTGGSDVEASDTVGMSADAVDRRVRRSNGAPGVGDPAAGGANVTPVITPEPGATAGSPSPTPGPTVGPGPSSPPGGGGSTPPSGGGSTPPSGGGSTPPSGGGSTPPSGGGSTPPSGGGSSPPAGGGGSGSPSAGGSGSPTGSASTPSESGSPAPAGSQRTTSLHPTPA